MSSYYAVRQGRIPGIYLTWNETKKQVLGFSGAQYKKFSSEEEAYEYLGISLPIESIITDDRIVEEGDDYLIVFTDGSSIGNNKKNKNCTASYAVVFPYHEELNMVKRIPKNEPQTNIRAELYAIALAIEISNKIDPYYQKTLIIYTDSEFSINVITEWMKGWKKKGWKKADGKEISNKDLVIYLDKLTQQRQLIMCHVYAHETDDSWFTTYNNKVDELTRSIYD